jgi:ectoine hydroxylase
MREDLYPSRKGAGPRILEREDRVVYAAWTPGAPLSQEQTRTYGRDGVLVLENLFTADEIRLLQREAAQLHRTWESFKEETAILEPGGQALRSVFAIHAQNDIFARLAADARLVKIARFLLRSEIYIHQSRLNYKPGFDGKDFYWHSDFETWHVEDGMARMRALSMSILLTENFPFNGPTMFIPGSHRRFISCVGETPDDHYRSSLRRQEYGVPDRGSLARLAEDGILMPTGEAGTTVIFDCNTLHGSNSNISPFPRSNVFFVYNAAVNRLEAPFGPAMPRPEWVASRTGIEIIQPVEGHLVPDAA